MDAAGNLYIADSGNQRIRKVDVNGTIKTLAGNGKAGFSGDGGLATAASLLNPGAVSVDGLGNAYIADTGNNTIPKVASDGTISTLPVFVLWPTGVLADAAGNVYVTPDHDRVVKITPNGDVVGVAGALDGGLMSLRDGFGDGGPATSALLAVPWTVALDLAGNLYIADSHFQRVRKVDPGGTITTFAGANPILFSAIDGYYVPGGFGGDNGPATSALLNFPLGVADRAGNIYIADAGNNRVRKISAAGASPFITAVTNGASFVRGLVPGGIVSIFGTNLSNVSGIVTADKTPLPT